MTHSCHSKIGIYGLYAPPLAENYHSAFNPSDLTSVDHLVSSLAISAAYSSGVDGRGSTPTVANRARMLSVARAARRSLLTCSMIGCGVPRGATNPNRSTTS